MTKEERDRIDKEIKDLMKFNKMTLVEFILNLELNNYNLEKKSQRVSVLEEPYYFLTCDKSRGCYMVFRRDKFLDDVEYVSEDPLKACLYLIGQTFRGGVNNDK